MDFSLSPLTQRQKPYLNNWFSFCHISSLQNIFLSAFRRLNQISFTIREFQLNEKYVSRKQLFCPVSLIKWCNIRSGKYNWTVFTFHNLETGIAWSLVNPCYSEVAESFINVKLLNRKICFFTSQLICIIEQCCCTPIQNWKIL